MLRFAILTLFSLPAAMFAAEGKITPVEKLPAGVNEKIAATLHKRGAQIEVDGKIICTLWRVESATAKDGFKPTLNVKYPFQPGQLLGVIEVVQASEFTDFRGQEVKPGVYTLRYGQQPVDGNHVGTSELYDFLLALPAKADADPVPAKSADDLIKRSASTAGSNHPAIFSLLPAEKAEPMPTLTHDDGKDFWILTSTLPVGGDKSIPVRLVVVGRSE